MCTVNRQASMAEESKAQTERSEVMTAASMRPKFIRAPGPVVKVSRVK